VVGMYHDPEIGDIEATSYFRVGLPGSTTIPVNAVYDSLKLLMQDNNFSIGDTLSVITLHVHRLTQALKSREDGYLYNTSSFSFDPSAMGTIAYIHGRTSSDTVKIKLDDAFGSELFNLFKTKDDKVSAYDNFLNYFKGFVVTFDPSDNVILGFKTSGTLPAMRLYYHYTDYSTLNKTLDFNISSATNLQFNHFTIRNPVYNWPVRQKDKLSVSLTDNMSFVQGGTGILTRIEIPYLLNLLKLHENMQVLRAELILEPARNKYKSFRLPPKVSLYSTDRLNRFVYPIVDRISMSLLVGSLFIDNLYQEETSYTFDITDFISAKLAEQTDEIPALLLTITPDDFYKSPDRLVLGSQLHADNTVKLKIYYMNYE